MDFTKFQQAVAKQFARLSKHELFRTKADQTHVWETYLNSFPEGTNPVFRERTVHDCSCCRQFVKNIGNVVAVIDGTVESIWDITVDEPAYQQVATSLSKFVKSHAIADLYRHYEPTVGVSKTFEDMLESNTVKAWDHFQLTLPAKVVMKKDAIDSFLGVSRSHRDVFYRSLREINQTALETTLELISQNSLYRGKEHEFAIREFLKFKKQFDLLGDNDKLAFAAVNAVTAPGSVTKIRNTSIGTLLVNVSEGMDLDKAVRAFEALVAPTNYKRPTAVVTKNMVESAKKKIEELGLTSALERRYARMSDMSVTNTLFADRSARKTMGDDLFDTIVTKTATPKLGKIEEMPIDRFVNDVLPHATSLEVFVENRMEPNFVSLITAADPTSNPLFKWDNSFSWSYNGDLADSIKERVKQAGGNVTGDLCCRLAWFNYDDLDFHMQEPGGNEIYFGNRQSQYTHGQLDVDMNVSRSTRTPVENIFYGDRRKMKEGTYHLYVEQFNKRESTDVGFEAEVDYLGTVHKFVYPKHLSNKARVTVMKFKYSHAHGIEILESLPTTQSSKTVWNVKTQEFHKVSLVTLSPNYWGETSSGNKHYFFMLQDCMNDGQARGFYNEFLRSDLDAYRKVIEIVGSKVKTQQSVDQLSGVGFSDTQRNELLVRVSGNFTRQLKILF